MNCLQNPPKLNINKVLYKDCSMPIHVRVEQRIVWNLLLVLEKAGYSVSAVEDGEERTKVREKKAAMELLFNLDDAYLFLEDGKGRNVWVRLVFGNGLDVISDWNAVGDFNKVMSGFKPEVYA